MLWPPLALVIIRMIATWFHELSLHFTSLPSPLLLAQVRTPSQSFWRKASPLPAHWNPPHFKTHLLSLSSVTHKEAERIEKERRVQKRKGKQWGAAAKENRGSSIPSPIKTLLLCYLPLNVSWLLCWSPPRRLLLLLPCGPHWSAGC